MIQPKYNLYRQGDTWNGRKYKFPFDLTGAVILCQFKNSPGARTTFEFKTQDNTILVPEPSNGEIFMVGRIMNYPAGKYYYDIQITFTDGTITTYAEDILTIFQDVSR